MDDEQREAEVIESLKRIGDKFVLLGLATSVICNDVTGHIHIQFTERGEVLRKEMNQIFDSLALGAKVSDIELQAFIILLSINP